MPVIDGVHGYAIAGGLGLILCCDIVVAASTARIDDSHAKVFARTRADPLLRRQIATTLAGDHQDPMVQHVSEWLITVQRPDGGWVEDERT